MEVMQIYYRIKGPRGGFAIQIKLAQIVEIAIAMFVVYAQHQCSKNASIWNRTIFLGAFMQGSSREGQLTPLVVGVKLDKKCTIFFIEFLRYSIGVCNNQNK